MYCCWNLNRDDDGDDGDHLDEDDDHQDEDVGEDVDDDRQDGGVVGEEDEVGSDEGNHHYLALDAILHKLSGHSLCRYSYDNFLQNLIYYYYSYFFEELSTLFFLVPQFIFKTFSAAPQKSYHHDLKPFQPSLRYHFYILYYPAYESAT